MTRWLSCVAAVLAMSQEPMECSEPSASREAISLIQLRGLSTKRPAPALASAEEHLLKQEPAPEAAGDPVDAASAATDAADQAEVAAAEAADKEQVAARERLKALEAVAAAEAAEHDAAQVKAAAAVKEHESDKAQLEVSQQHLADAARAFEEAKNVTEAAKQEVVESREAVDKLSAKEEKEAREAQEAADRAARARENAPPAARTAADAESAAEAETTAPEEAATDAMVALQKTEKPQLDRSTVQSVVAMAAGKGSLVSFYGGRVHPGRSAARLPGPKVSTGFPMSVAFFQFALIGCLMCFAIAVFIAFQTVVVQYDFDQKLSKKTTKPAAAPLS
mmetsp:Transcript_13932/g.33708  ORF Transcript_13932/g.33708 Transcript_13932/m.33708 type:complete len:336 (+) Transcript_13932:82-1089(+)